MSDKPQSRSFEEVAEELESIVTQLEQGEQTLEASLKLYERAVGLERLGQKILNDAQERIDILSSDESELSNTANPT